MKRGDKVMVGGEIKGYGRDLGGIVREIEKLGGGILVRVILREGCGEGWGRRGGCLG